MTLQELRYLVALSEKGNFVRAAESCCIGQSTLSTQIMKLEGYLGVTLFQRGKQPVSLTPIGQKIIEKARAALLCTDQIKQLARQYNDQIHGLVRLGSVHTLGPYLFPHLLSEIRTSFPSLNICPFEDFTERLLGQLRQGRLDALLMPLPLPLPLKGDDIETLELCNESFVIALPSNHELTKKHQIALENLKYKELLILEKRHCMHDQVRAFCCDTEIEQADELIASSLPNLLSMVASGIGLAIIPQFATLSEYRAFSANDVVIRPFAPPKPQRGIGLLWPKRSVHKKLLRSLGEFIRVYVIKLLETGGENSAQRSNAVLTPQTG